MHVSSKTLPPHEQAELVARLSVLLADLKTPDQVKAFLQDFLSPAELSILTKRLGVLWYLQQGMSYEAIKARLFVSSATIASTAEMGTKAGIKAALSTLNLDQWADKMASKLLKLSRWSR